MNPFLQTQEVTKRYPGIVALDSVSLSLMPGSVHALIGENGAGKSTFIKIVSGVIHPEEGRILVDGVPSRLESPRAAHRAGIAVVHQHTHLIPDLTIAENYALRQGYTQLAPGAIAWGAMRTRAQEAAALLAPDIDVRRDARSLSGVEQQLIELSFGFAGAPSLVILDEPTAILPHRETDQLFERVQQYVADGGCVLFVTHRLEEVFRIATEVTVLRDGKTVWTKPIGETDHDDLIRGMVGRSVSFERDPESLPGEETSVAVSGLSDAAGAFSGIDMTLRHGEIYGVYGLVGAGQSELCQALFGLRSVSEGTLQMGDRRIDAMAPWNRVDEGLAYVPADRLIQGVFPQLSVGENMSVAAMRKLCSGVWIRKSEELARNTQSVQDLRVKTQGLEQRITHLSGGNQQKVMLARWLETEPSLLILEEPTQGVDVGAKGEIHRIVIDLAKRGVTVLLVSTEIPELLALSHRIGVMREGKLVAEYDAAAADDKEILRQALPDVHAKSETDDSSVSRRRGGFLGAVLDAVTAQREAGLAVILGVLLLLLSFGVNNFATTQNFLDLLQNNAIVLVGALGMMFVIIAGGIDISVGAIMGLAAVAVGKLDLAGVPAAGLLVTALALGAMLGAANGIVSTAGRVHPIVVTLGTLFIFRSLITLATGGKWILNLSDRTTFFGQQSIASVPVLLAVAACAVAAAHWFLRYTVTGRRLYVFGGSSDSAEYLGVYRRHVVPVAFALCGLLTGLAALLQAGKFGQVQNNVGQGFELKVIAAAVIGGTNIMGGRGSAFGTLVGTLFLGVIANVLVLMHISAFWEQVVVGGLILAAIGADHLLTRYRANK